METEQTDLKHRNIKTDNKKTAATTESESESEQQKNDSQNVDTAAAANAATTTTTNNVPTVIRTKEEYFDALRVWLQQVQLQQMAYAYFPYYLSANLPPNMHNAFNASMPFSTSTAAPAAAGRFPAFPATPLGINQPGAGIGFNFPNAGGNAGERAPFIGNNIFQNRNQYMENMRQNMQILYQNGGYEYVIAPIWKRVLAEAIDVIILFIIKLMVVFMMIDLFNIQIVSLDFDSLRSSLEEDYLEFLSFSSDLLLVEILTKVMVCIYEAMWTAHGQSMIGGATPGKIIMGIRILYVEAVVPVGQINAEPNFNATTQRALMYPAANPGFRRALLRAIAKNMLMTLMFPMCFVLLFFRNNRTGYDVMTKTIVVEENPVPIRRQL